MNLTEEDFEKACNCLIRIRNEENRREVNVALYCVLDKWFNMKEHSIKPILDPQYNISWEKTENGCEPLL